ncbi:MAG: fibronectin type III domain-containing protein [Kofleriaceae bacterium]|nr:fibronectin type III domain-containing protein [Kofleriaceae bacterium]
MTIFRSLWVLALAAMTTVGTLGGCVASDSLDEQTSEYGAQVALAPPTNLTLTVVSSVRIDLQWDASPGAANYVLYRGAAPGATRSYTSVGTNFFNNGHLTPNTQYCYTVRNINSAGEVSGASNEVCAMTNAGSTTPAPATITATAVSSSRISLSWSAVPNATTYRVFQGLTNSTLVLTTSTTAPATTYVAAGLAPGTSYSFYVEAVAITGTSVPSATVSATTFSLGLEGYWKFDENMGATIVDASGYARNGTLSSATFSTDRPHVFRRTNKSVGSIGTDTNAQIAVPYNSELRLATTAWTVSMWVKPSGDTMFAGMRSANCGSVIWGIGANATNGLFFRDASTTRASNVAVPVGQWSQIALVANAGTLTFYIDGIQVASQPYASVARSANSPLVFGHGTGCTGAAVLVDEMQMYSRALTAGDVAKLGVRPAAPQNFTVTNTCSTVQKTSWQAVAGAQRYYLSRGTAPGNETFLTSVGSTLTTFSVGVLTPATQYSWFLESEVNDIYSLPSNEVVLTTLAIPVAPVVTATTLSNSRIRLDWAAVPNANRYSVLMSAPGGGLPFTPKTTSLAPGPLTIALLAPNTTYSFVLRSIDACNMVSPDSAPATATTAP